MFRLDKYFVIAVGLLGILCFFPLAAPTSFSVDQTIDPKFSSIPYQIGNWTGKDEAIDERTYQILETKNVLSRLYEAPDKSTVHLLLVASHKDRRVAHPPEVCYTSSNYDIMDSKSDTVQISGTRLPVKRFIAQNQTNPEYKQHVLYLYKVGDQFTSNYYAQQLRFAMDTLSRQDSKIWLIRLSGPSEGSFDQFLSEVLPHLS